MIPAIMMMLPKLLQAALAIAKAMVVLGEGMKALAQALEKLGEACGLLDKNSNIEDLGTKALLAEQDGVKAEDFKKYGDYLAQIEKYDVNSKDAGKLNESDKLQKGIEVFSAEMLDKFPNLQMKDFLLFTSKNPSYFTGQRMMELGKLMTSNEKGFNDACLYMTGKAKDDKVIDNAIDTLKGIEKNITPDISDKDALKNAISSRG